MRLDKDEYLPEDRAEALVLKQKKEEDAAQKLVSKCGKKVEGGSQWRVVCFDNQIMIAGSWMGSTCA